MPSLIGQSLGRYHILEQLGEGGMATVYKARDLNLDRDVALKVIRTDIFGSSILERMLKRFQREGRTLGKLTHPNIVPILDFGEHNGAPYLVMPYLPGGTLKQKLKGQLPYRQTVQMLIPVAQALVHAHQQGVIHRDVKPANILLTRTGELMLSDFGIARIIDAEETRDLTSTGVGIGTPEYMAPEQGMGQADERSDIYALGIVLYEMVTGRIPFRANTPMAVLLKKSQEALPRPTQFVPDLPQAVENVLIKALTKDPANRFQTMAECTRALDAILKDQLVSASSGASVAGTLSSYNTFSTVLQADSGATNIHNTTQDSISLSRIPSIATQKDEPTRKKKSKLPLSLIAGMAGFALLIICGIGVVAATRLAASETPPTSAPYIAPSSQPIKPTTTSVPDHPQDRALMIYIPSGEFRMGSNDYNPDESPSHIVTVASYWIDKTEVTNAMYAECVQARVCNQPEDSRYYERSNFANHPVVFVTWYDAKNYCEWRDARLPTEAEWEKAASWDDNKKEKRDYPWGNTSDCLYANLSTSCVGRTAKVGSYPSSASFYGVLDMAGNVWEWVSDWYDAYSDNPINRQEYGKTYRVVKGGAWRDSGNCVRTSCRGWVIPEYFDDGVGFRCASTIQ